MSLIVKRENKYSRTLVQTRVNKINGNSKYCIGYLNVNIWEVKLSMKESCKENLKVVIVNKNISKNAHFM